MKTVYFVRHGESEGNISFVYQTTDAPLTTKGREQATFIARRVARLPVDIIISSPAVRTKETADTIAKEIDKPVEYSELFAERRTPSELWGRRVDDPEIAHISDKIFQFDKDNYRFSNEENFTDLKMRANAALLYLEQRPESHILVVSHGLFTRTIAARVLLGENITGQEYLRVLRAIRTRNTGLTVLNFKKHMGKSPEGPGSNWQLLVWNDHAHLG